jgi:hypothetical protein
MNTCYHWPLIAHYTTTIKIYLILPAALGPGVYSAAKRNEYQKHKVKGKEVKLFSQQVVEAYRVVRC